MNKACKAVVSSLHGVSPAFQGTPVLCCMVQYNLHSFHKLLCCKIWYWPPKMLSYASRP